jgi:hypothetical protein
MSDLSVRPYNEGQVRAADSLLRSLGGFSVGLRVPTAAAAVDGEQLGISSPLFQDLPLSPVVFRKLRSVMVEGQTGKYELLVSSSAVAAAVSVQQVASSDVLLAMATGIVVDRVLFLIEATSFSEWQGSVFVYRILLRESLPDAAEETVS